MITISVILAIITIIVSTLSGVVSDWCVGAWRVGEV